jgi:TolB-like protein
VKKFIEELKRRNVIKATIAYLVVAWILLQVFTILLPIVDAQDWILKTLTLIMAIGLPIWIVISWVYDITPEGIEVTPADSEKQIKREITNKRLNVFIIVSLSIAVIVLTLKVSNVFTDTDKEYSIAVIPFDNIRVDEGNEWLAQNFTQSVNSYLSKVKKLKVIDSYSTSKYKDTNKSNSEIGQDLDVSHLLRATVTQLKNKLSITVFLINVISNTVVWSDSYDENIEEDPLKLQQEMSQKIVEQLKVTLTTEDEKALETLLTSNLEASIFFTEGVRIADKRTAKNLDSILTISANMLQKAIDLDPNFADAYAEKAFVLRLMSDKNEFYKNVKDKFIKINALLKKSLEINPNTVRAYTTLGMLNMSLERNWKKAKENYDKALAIKPNDASTHHYYALYLIQKPEPDYDKALEHIKIAHRLNPFSTPINITVFRELLRAEKIMEAEAFYKNNSHLFSDDGKLRLKRRIFEAKVKKEIFEKKDWSEAINIYHREIEQDSINSYLHRELARAYNQILNDDKNYLKYAKKAYELGKLYSENDDIFFMSSNADAYYFAFLKNKEFKEANKLLQDNYFRSLFSEQRLFYLEFYYYYFQGNFGKAQTSIDRYIFDKSHELTINYAQQNKLKEVNALLKKDFLNHFQKAIVFAILKERDSMYFYINKEKNIYNILEFNGSIEVDPYRKEERYKAFLKKNYLPLLTTWNE